MCLCVYILQAAATLTSCVLFESIVALYFFMALSCLTECYEHFTVKLDHVSDYHTPMKI